MTTANDVDLAAHPTRRMRRAMRQGEYLMRIHSRVCDQLRRCAFLHSPEGIEERQIIQLLIMPLGPSPVTAWDVMETWDAEEGKLNLKSHRYRLHRTIWRNDLDFPYKGLRWRFRPQPTIETSAQTLPDDQAERLLDSLRSLHVPLWVQSKGHWRESMENGQGPTNYELLMGSHVWTTRLNWTGGVPADWQPLRPVIQDMQSLFATVFGAAAGG